MPVWPSSRRSDSGAAVPSEPDASALTGDDDSADPGRGAGRGVRLAASLARPVDIAALVYVRVCLGAILCWELLRYLDLGRPRAYYSDAVVHFTFWPFDWVTPMPAAGMNSLFVVLAAAAAAMAAGLFFRAAAIVLWIGLTYVFLLDRAYYLNHWYLAGLLVFLVGLTPANAAWSLDVRSGAVARRTTVPAWTVWVFRFQMGVVYFFAGLSKITADWLAGRPLYIWLQDERDFPVIGSWFEHRSVAAGMAIAAMVFDVIVVALLLDRRSRRFAYPIAIGFHLMNSRLFDIGMFPWAMLALTAVFFEPAFPRRMIADLRSGRHLVSTLAGAVTVSTLGALLPHEVTVAGIGIGALAGAIAGYHLGGGGVTDDGPELPTVMPSSGPAAHETVSRAVLVFLGVWVAVQLALPLRPYVFPGDAAWTEEGQQFAWRLLLRTKTGQVTFRVTDPITGEERLVNPDQFLTGGQMNNIGEQPDMMIQFARWLEQDLSAEMGGHDLVVTVESSIVLNGRPPAPLIDPTVDLTRVERPWWPPAPWILPPPEARTDGE